MIRDNVKIITFPLYNTCYPQNLARKMARFLNHRLRKGHCILKEENIMLIL
jgi:hypothetical protein